MPRIGRRLRMATVLTMIGLPALAAVCLAWRAGPREESEALRAVTSGRYAEAAEVLERRLRGAPRSAEAHLLKGRVAVARDRLPDAAEELKVRNRSAAGRDELRTAPCPDRRQGWPPRRGRARAEPGVRRGAGAGPAGRRSPGPGLSRDLRLKRAAAVLDRWARDFPDDPKPHLWCAEVHARDGHEAGRVLEDYREALRRDPDLAPARLGVAEELRKAHRNAEAADAYKRLSGPPARRRGGAGSGPDGTWRSKATTRRPAPPPPRDRAGRPERPGPRRAGASSAPAAATGRPRWRTSTARSPLDPFDVWGRGTVAAMALARLGRAAEAQAEQAAANRLRDDLKVPRGAVAAARLAARPGESARGRPLDVRCTGTGRRGPGGPRRSSPSGRSTPTPAGCSPTITTVAARRGSPTGIA